MGKREGEITIEKPRRRRYIIKINLQTVGGGGMGWIDLAQDRDR